MYCFIAALAVIAAVNPDPLPPGTEVALMVINEVSTKTAKAGDRFLLRVQTPVMIDGVVAIPAGTSAYGEVATATESGIAGRSGKLTTRLLYVDLQGRHVPLVGTPQNIGKNGNVQIVIATLGLTPWGLVARGNNAKLKAGDTVTGTIATPLP